MDNQEYEFKLFFEVEKGNCIAKLFEYTFYIEKELDGYLLKCVLFEKSIMYGELPHFNSDILKWVELNETCEMYNFIVDLTEQWFYEME